MVFFIIKNTVLLNCPHTDAKVVQSMPESCRWVRSLSNVGVKYGSPVERCGQGVGTAPILKVGWVGKKYWV